MAFGSQNRENRFVLAAVQCRRDDSRYWVGCRNWMQKLVPSSSFNLGGSYCTTPNKTCNNHNNVEQQFMTEGEIDKYEN